MIAGIKSCWGNVIGEPVPGWVERSLVFSGATIISSALAYFVSVELVCGLVVLLSYIAVKKARGLT